MIDQTALKTVWGTRASSAFQAAARERRVVESPVDDDYVDTPLEDAIRRFFSFQKWAAPLADLNLPIDPGGTAEGTKLALTCMWTYIAYETSLRAGTESLNELRAKLSTGGYSDLGKLLGVPVGELLWPRPHTIAASQESFFGAGRNLRVLALLLFDIVDRSIETLDIAIPRSQWIADTSKMERVTYANWLLGEFLESRDLVDRYDPIRFFGSSDLKMVGDFIRNSVGVPTESDGSVTEPTEARFIRLVRAGLSAEIDEVSAIVDALDSPGVGVCYLTHEHKGAGVLINLRDPDRRTPLSAKPAGILRRVAKGPTTTSELLSPEDSIAGKSSIYKTVADKVRPAFRSIGFDGDPFETLREKNQGAGTYSLRDDIAIYVENPNAGQSW